MTTENENTKVANYSNSFAFGMVGVMLTHNQRLFEHLEKEMQAYTPFLLEHEHFNDKETRMEFFQTMESLKDLAELTKGYSDKELKLVFKKMSKKAMKKLGKELNDV